MNRTVFLLALLQSLVPFGLKQTTADIRIEAVGIKAIEEVEVPARVVGVLEEISVREGQRVVADETVLARLDTRDAELELERSRIEYRNACQMAHNDVKVRMARQSLKLAELDLGRAQDSLVRYPMSITQAQIDRLVIAVEQAKLEIEQARRELDSAQLASLAARNQLDVAERNLSRHRVVSPIDGTVVQIHRRKGEWVEPGQTVVRIVRSDRFRAEGFIHIRRLTKDLTGCPVTLAAGRPGGGMSEFHGKVTFVSPEANPVNGQIRIWAEIEDRDAMLRPGLVATLVIDDSTESVSEGDASPDSVNPAP